MCKHPWVQIPPSPPCLLSSAVEHLVYTEAVGGSIPSASMGIPPIHVKGIMTKKTFKKIDKKGHEEIWEWDETPEVVAALKKLHATVKTNRMVVITE